MDIGTRYNNEIYFYMSRGILNPNIMETIPNQQVLQSVMLAPSIILTEAWESQEFKSFYTSIFNNLFEDTADERKLLNGQTALSATSTPDQPPPPLIHLTECFGYRSENWSAEKYHYRWNITENEIEDELDKQLTEKVSFVFVLKWLQNKGKKSELLDCIKGEADGLKKQPVKVVSVN